MIVPRFTQDRCVIISDGGVESLIACAMASEQQQLSNTEPSMLLPGWWEWTDEIDLMISAIDPAVVRQASVYGINIFQNHSVYPPDDQQLLADSSIGSIQSRILLEAAQIAIRSGIRKVVWPIRVMRPETRVGMDQLIDTIGNTVDRAILASRLASLDADQDTAVDVTIETPFVDLSNEQMLDLASDLAVPVEACWWHAARELPNAQERIAYWSKMTLRSPGTIEPKSQSYEQSRSGI